MIRLTALYSLLSSINQREGEGDEGEGGGEEWSTSSAKMKNESQLMFRKSTIILDYLYLHFLSFIFAP